MKSSDGPIKVTPGNIIKMYILGYIIKKKSNACCQEIKDSIQMLNSTWNISNGTIYPVIKKMIEQGLIEYSYEFDNRKFYGITQEGIKYYELNIENYKESLQERVNFYAQFKENLI